LPTGKIPTAAQHERLVHRLLEAPVPLLNVAVLMRVAGLDLLTAHPVVIQQRLIPPCKLLPLCQVVHRGAHSIRPVPRRHRAQFPHRVLDTFAQAFKALREADRRRLPVRIGQHEMVDQVLERLSLDRHAQVVHAREVRRRQPAWFVYLGEKHFLG
jgi:hypothetical protein